MVLLMGCGASPSDQVLQTAERLAESNQLEKAWSVLDEYHRSHADEHRVREAQILLLLRGNQLDAALEMHRQLAERTPLVTFFNDAIRHADPAVRANTCFLIAETKPSNSEYLLTRVATDPEIRVRRAAVRSLAKFKGKKVVHALETALLDNAWQVRADAADALERLCEPFTAEALFQTMLDDDEYVRLKVRRALQAVMTDENISVYRRALKHRQPHVRSAAALALASRGDDSASVVLMETLYDPDSTLRVSAARALAHLGERSARPLLRESLIDSSPIVRATAALALAELQDYVATNRLAALASSDPIEGVRLAAAHAYQMLIPASPTLTSPPSP